MGGRPFVRSAAAVIGAVVALSGCATESSPEPSPTESVGSSTAPEPSATEPAASSTVPEPPATEPAGGRTVSPAPSAEPDGDEGAGDQVQSVEARFGDTAVLTGGSDAIRIDAPAAYQPSESAHGSRDWNHYIVVSVTETNLGEDPRPSGWQLNITPDITDSERIYDPDRGIPSEPQEMLQPGESFSYQAVFGVESDAALKITASPPALYDQAIFS